MQVSSEGLIVVDDNGSGTFFPHHTNRKAMTHFNILSFCCSIEFNLCLCQSQTVSVFNFGRQGINCRQGYAGCCG